MKDLIILVADKSMQFTLQGGLSQPRRLGVRTVSFDFLQHPNRDGGVRTTGAQLLALQASRFTHALLVLDHEGSGAAQTEPLHLEASLDAELQPAWGDRGKAIVIVPELDVWMWGSDAKLAEILRWPRPEPIRQWLRENGFSVDHHGKPSRPKEALEAIFPVCRLPRSAATYRDIASQISLARCTDPAFARLRHQLQAWFPEESPR